MWGTWDNDYLQHNFTPMQDVVLEFDAQIGAANMYGYSLLIRNRTIAYQVLLVWHFVEMSYRFVELRMVAVLHCFGGI